MTPTSRRVIVVTLLALLLALSVTLPIEQTITGPCVIEAASSWYVMRNGAGQITTGWARNLTGLPQRNLMIQFERPDVVTLDYKREVTEGSFVKAGDTLLWIESYEGVNRLEDLESARDVATNELEALHAGARAVDIEVAEQEYRRASAELEFATQDYDRVMALRDSGYAADADIQAATSRYHAAVAGADGAQAAIRALKQGARAQDLATGESRVSQLETSISNAEKLLGKRQYISAPLTGKVTFESPTTDYLLQVNKYDTLAVLVQIPESAVPLVGDSGELTVQLEGISTPLKISVKEFWYSSTIDPAAFAVGLVASDTLNLAIGMYGSATCSLGKRTLLEGARARLGSFAL
jgi:hypothetical protein